MPGSDLWNVRDVYERPLGGPFNALDRGPAVFAEAISQLDEYVAGERRRFDLELDLGGSPFQGGVASASSMRQHSLI